MNKDEILGPVLQAINDLRAEVRENKKEIREMREENNKRWDENDRRWDENDRRWEENNKLWEENKKQWEENKMLWREYRKNRETDKKELFDILLKYDISISTQLGDKNAQKMKKILKI